MVKNTKNFRITARSTALAVTLGATLIFSLLTPTVAQAAEPSGSSDSGSSSREITPKELHALSSRQIAESNRGTETFSASDLIGQAKAKVDEDRAARDARLAAEAAAKAAAEAQAKAEAEAAAKAEADRIAAEKAAADKLAADALKKSSSNQNTSSAPSAPFYQGGGSKDEWLTAAGIAESDWGYVDYIVSKESGWNPNAVNSSSGASGLVQALPCGKVPGSCFNPVDNLKWADGYAKGRYGSWAEAYAFWTSNHWW